MNYIINEKTQVIKNVQSENFRTKIYEENRIYYSRYSQQSIINDSCVHNGSSLRGRWKLVRKILRTNSKLPIPLTPQKGIYLVPTTSIRNEACIWFSYYHIDYYVERDNQLAIFLKDGTVYLINISYNQFDLQYKKTSQIIAYFHQLLCLS